MALSATGSHLKRQPKQANDIKPTRAAAVDCPAVAVHAAVVGANATHLCALTQAISLDCWDVCWDLFYFFYFFLLSKL